MTEVLLLLLTVALIAAGACFVAAEFSFITVSRPAVESDAESGDKRAVGLLAALRTLSTQLSGAQVGITVTNLGMGYLAQPAIAELIRPVLLDAGLNEAAVASTSITIALLLVTSVTMVFGELVPKNLAIAKPMATARAVQGFQRGFTRSIAWVIRFFNGVSNAILRAIGIEPQEELASARSGEELTALVRHSAKQGTLAEETAELLERSLAFGDRLARDAMSPRSRMVSLSPDESVADLVSHSKLSGHSRFPVVDIVEHNGHDEAHVLGVAHIRSALRVPFEARPTTAVTEVMSEPTLVPDSMELDDLMDLLRDGGLQMAVLIDEFGSLAGIVTLEDLVEEIVGEVRDEHDYDEHDRTHEVDGSWTLDGLLRVDEASDIVEHAFPEDDAYDTLGGLVTASLGAFGEVGDVVTVPSKPEPGAQPVELVLEVLAVDGHRIDSVRVRVEPVDEENDDDPGLDEEDDPSGDDADASAGSAPEAKKRKKAKKGKRKPTESAASDPKEES